MSLDECLHKDVPRALGSARSGEELLTHNLRDTLHNDHRKAIVDAGPEKGPPSRLPVMILPGYATEIAVCLETESCPRILLPCYLALHTQQSTVKP